MSWRTVVISNNAKLDYQIGYLVVRGTETTKIHLNEIGTLIIESTAVSVNAVPDSCTLYLDRRTTVEENEEYLAGEMDELIKGTDASWEVYEVEGTSYMGAAVRLHSLLPAWELPGEHPLALAAEKCFREVLGREPETCRWDFSTNGVTTAGRLGIPTLGFGAGIEKMAHQTDEYCPVEDLIKACEFYSRLPQYL